MDLKSLGLVRLIRVPVKVSIWGWGAIARLKAADCFLSLSEMFGLFPYLGCARLNKQEIPSRLDWTFLL